MKNEIMETKTQLPATMEDLSKFILIAREKIKSVKAEIRAIEKLGLAKDVYIDKLNEGKELGAIVLYAKVKMGDLLRGIPKEAGRPKKIIDTVVDNLKKETKQEKVKELGFNQKDSERFQQLADNRDIVEEVIENSEDIPTQTECFKKIKQRKLELKKKENEDNLKNISQLPIDSSIKILEGDLFEQIKKVKDNSIDLLCTDPPYFILSEDWDTFKDKDDFLKFTERWLKAVMPKVKKDTGRIYISFANEYKFDLYNILAKNNFFDFIFGNEIIWIKRNNNKRSNKKNYRFWYESIFYLYGKDAAELNFLEFGEIQSNTWTIAVPQSNFKEGKYHPCQKPIELYQRIISTGSKPEDLILDCFAGSGTTGVVCKELKRNCILIERDKNYIKIVKGRINNVESK